jgi:hypothetical protein
MPSSALTKRAKYFCPRSDRREHRKAVTHRGPKLGNIMLIKTGVPLDSAVN